MKETVKNIANDFSRNEFTRHYAETKTCPCCLNAKKKMKELKSKGVKL